MRKFLTAALLLAIALSFCFAVTETSDSDATAGGVLIFEVNGLGDDDGVSIKNYGTSDVDLKGYRVADSPDKKKEGYLLFESQYVLHPGDVVTVVVKDLDGSKFTHRYDTLVPGERGLKSVGSFVLSNSGDDVYLIKETSTGSETIVDAFCYGGKKIDDSTLWTGEPFKTKKNCFFERKDVDTNSASDWFNFKVGWTNISFDPDMEMSATVTPFLFPESGGIPIYEELEKAEKSVKISVYQLLSKDVIGLLDQLSKKGVQVSILLEDDVSTPVTVNHALAEIRTLVDDGCDVRIIEYGERYLYVHSKYCIIDDETVIITSENWTVDNLNRNVVEDPTKGKGNRGWGVIIESPQYAAFMSNVFENDFDKSYGDVHDFTELKTISGATVSYETSSTLYPTSSFTCTITPVLSPDSSWDATLYYIDNAKTRVYSQQQSLSPSYSDVTTESPIKHMADKAKQGLDVRFILNSATEEKEAQQDVQNINTTSYIKAANMKKPYVHNKGVVCDDTVLVSSVNWTDTSFTSNRESCVAIHSKGVADYFANAFIKDFDRNYTYSGLKVTFSEIKDNYDKAGDITISVNVDQEGTFTYEWDLDGQKKTTSIPRAVFNVSDGKHTITVTVSGDGMTPGSASASFSVGSSSGGDDDKDKSGIMDNLDKYKMYLIPAIVILLALLGLGAKSMSGGNKKKSSKKGGKKR